MFKKSVVVGVAITPEAGLEVAQIDYNTKTVQKYGRKSLDYNLLRREIADLDLFKETLQDLLGELDIPKGAELVLTFPTVNFKVNDYPASLDPIQIENAIEEDVYENPFLKNYEPCISYAVVNSSLQFNKVAYTAIQKSVIIEIILSIKELGYNVKMLDTSISSLLRALVYLDKIDTEAGTSWVLLTIENNCCRILSMIGRNYIDAYEEKISIGEVLTDAENYATVIAAVEPILKNLPSKYLYVVSKTNVISAEVIANKITYSAPIIYQELNIYRKDAMLELSDLVNPEEASVMTLDIVGSCIYPQYAMTSNVNLNFFNATLGDVYFNEQPPSIMGGKLVLTNERLFMFFILYAIFIAVLLALIFVLYTTDKIAKENTINGMQQEISTISEYIETHKDVSAETFDEGDEIKMGLLHNKGIYSYYTIMGTEIPEKLWLTHIAFGNKTVIEGQADNLESVYAFYRNIKDYTQNTDVILQRLGLATTGDKLSDFDTQSVLTSLDADFYDFCISNDTACANKNSGTQNDLPSNLEPIN